MIKSNEQFIAEVKQINPNIIIVGKYIKATERIIVKCGICNHEWNPKAYSLTQGKGCPKCGTKRGVLNNHGKTHKKSTDEFKKQLNSINNKIEIIGEYMSHHSNIKCKCKRCDNIWVSKAYSLLQGHGCPKCSKSGTSFMEQFIKLSFEKATNCNVLSRDRKTIGMELDILIPELKIAIEPGNWLLHKKYLDRDKMKREKCSEIGIKLITIYDKFPINEKNPFSSNCIVFNDDYNKADHSEIRNLVNKLFIIAGVKTKLSLDDYNEIEYKAYENAKAMNNDTFVLRMSKLHPSIEVIDKYYNSNKRIRVRCKKCGFEWFGVPFNMLAGDACRKCGTKLAHQKLTKSQEDFVKEVAKANKDIEIIGHYQSRHKTVKAKCKICGFEWEPTASSLLRGSNHKGSKTIHKLMK